MSQARSFTIELTQVGTGKKATVKVNQGGFTPKYVFKWNNQPENPIKYFSVKAIGSDGNKITSGSFTNTKSTINGGIQHIDYKVTSNNDSIIDGNIEYYTNYISFEILPNPTYSERSVTITITQEESGKTLTLIVRQEAKSDDGIFKADPTALSFEASSDTKSSKITSTSKGQTVGWTVSNKSSMPSWLTISGEGTGTLSANVKDNA
jgi:hypothetical protein